MTNENNNEHQSIGTKKFNLDAYRMSQNYSEAVSVKKIITQIAIKKPNKQSFIRVKYDGTEETDFKAHVLELKEQSETYLVTPDLAPDILGELTAKQFYITIDRQKNLFLWPVKIAMEGENLDNWNTSAHLAAEKARNSWIRVQSNRSAGHYETFQAFELNDEPEWPNLSLQEIIELAFRGYVIDSYDHPILKKLRGQI